jgi:hypothetical protein
MFIYSNIVKDNFEDIEHENHHHDKAHRHRSGSNDSSDEQHRHAHKSRDNHNHRDNHHEREQHKKDHANHRRRSSFDSVSPPLDSPKHRNRHSSLSVRDGGREDSDSRFKTNSRLSFRDDEPDTRNHHHNQRSDHRGDRHTDPRSDRRRARDDLSPDFFDERPRSRNRGQTSRSGSTESLRSMLRKSALDMIDESKQQQQHQRSKSNSSLRKTSTQLFEAKYQAAGKASIDSEHDEPKSFKKWIRKSMRGGFYLNTKQEGLVSNSYALELHTSSSVYFTIETYKTPLSTSKYFISFVFCCLSCLSCNHCVEIFFKTRKR